MLYCRLRAAQGRGAALGAALAAVGATCARASPRAVLHTSHQYYQIRRRQRFTFLHCTLAHPQTTARCHAGKPKGTFPATSFHAEQQYRRPEHRLQAGRQAGGAGVGRGVRRHRRHRAAGGERHLLRQQQQQLLPQHPQRARQRRVRPQGRRQELRQERRQQLGRLEPPV